MPEQPPRLPRPPRRVMQALRARAAAEREVQALLRQMLRAARVPRGEAQAILGQLPTPACALLEAWRQRLHEEAT